MQKFNESLYISGGACSIQRYSASAQIYFIIIFGVSTVQMKRWNDSVRRAVGDFHSDYANQYLRKGQTVNK